MNCTSITGALNPFFLLFPTLMEGTSGFFAQEKFRKVFISSKIVIDTINK